MFLFVPLKFHKHSSQIILRNFGNFVGTIWCVTSNFFQGLGGKIKNGGICCHPEIFSHLSLKNSHNGVKLATTILLEASCSLVEFPTHQKSSAVNPYLFVHLSEAFSFYYSDGHYSLCYQLSNWHAMDTEPFASSIFFYLALTFKFIYFPISHTWLWTTSHERWEGVRNGSKKQTH